MGIKEGGTNLNVYPFNQRSAGIGPQDSVVTFHTSNKYSNTTVLLTVRFVYCEDESVEMSASVYPNNVYAGQSGLKNGPLEVLAPGDSLTPEHLRTKRVERQC